MEHLRLAKYQDIMLISGKQFEVGNAVYTNILVPNIRILKQRISLNISWKTLKKTMEFY